MIEQTNRIAWLEGQLSQVRSFLERDRILLQQDPGDFAVELSLGSWESRQEDLLQELRQARSALQREIVELRLMGMRMDGSIPLKLLSKLSDKFNSALAHAAFHLRFGRSPKKGVPEDLAQEMDLRLAGLSYGSTRLVFAGNVAPDTTGESAMGGALEQIFEVLQDPSEDKFRELVAAIGVPATRALSELLSELEKRAIGAELTWPAPNATIHKWGGSLEAVRVASERLSSVEKFAPTPVEISGEVSGVKDTGAIHVRPATGKPIKVSYNKQQYGYAQTLRLGLKVKIKAMKYTRLDPISGQEYSSYKLISEDV